MIGIRVMKCITYQLHISKCPVIQRLDGWPERCRTTQNDVFYNVKESGKSTYSIFYIKYQFMKLRHATALNDRDI